MIEEYPLHLVPGVDAICASCSDADSGTRSNEVLSVSQAAVARVPSLVSLREKKEISFLYLSEATDLHFFFP